MVAFVTHTLRIVLLVCMGAFCDRFSCPPHFATFWLALNHYRVGMQLNALLFFIIFEVGFLSVFKGHIGSNMLIRT